MIITPSPIRPTLSYYARNASQSVAPNLWTGLHLAYWPFLGPAQGRVDAANGAIEIWDRSGKGRHSNATSRQTYLPSRMGWALRSGVATMVYTDDVHGFSNSPNSGLGTYCVTVRINTTTINLEFFRLIYTSGDGVRWRTGNPYTNINCRLEDTTGAIVVNLFSDPGWVTIGDYITIIGSLDYDGTGSVWMTFFNHTTGSRVTASDTSLGVNGFAHSGFVDMRWSYEFDHLAITEWSRALSQSEHDQIGRDPFCMARMRNVFVPFTDAGAAAAAAPSYLPLLGVG